LQFLGFHDIPSWGASSPLTLDFAAAQTGQFSTGTTINPATGLPLASFLLGAVNTGSYTQYAPQYLETRSYTHQMAFYVNDDYRVTSKLTANVGLRWDIITPMQEAANHFSFLNATMTNPVTGTPGALQFAGNGTDSCNCSTPANTYYKNFGPRLGAAYALNDKTVIRASYGMYYGLTNGGTGSSGVSASGLQSGYSAAPSVISPGVSAPAFYLNNSGYNASLNNSAFGGPGYSVTAPPIVDPRYGTFYSTAAVAPYNVSTTLGYIDPYYGNRVPQFTEWSLGFQRLLTRDITATVSYVGNQAHFLYNGAARGYYNDQMDPKYLTLGSNLTNTSTSANIATAGLTAPYSTYPTSGATIQQMLQPFPQYKGTSDLYGEVANANYNALQISVTGRKWRGLNFLVNYTYSKSIDDDGTFRSGYAIPAGLVANSSQGWAIDRIERSYSVTDTPHNLTAYATYDLPFGKGHIGGGNAIVSNIIGGWSFSSIYTYISGLPLALTGTCKITLGTCEPTYNPAFSGNPMPNGKWGQGATAASLATTQYISPTAFVNTSTLTNPYVIGNVARTAPLKLRGAANYNIDSTLKRTFNIYGQGRVKFVFEASAFNTTNHVWFGSPGSNDAGGASIGTTVGSSTLGTVTKQANNPRQLQFAGHINF